MKKALAEIIAGVIPRKMARNRWRGILRFGVWRALRLKKEIRKNRSPHRHYLAVCAIAKNEGPYLREWIEWHRKMGVEKFYFYDNESTDLTRKVLDPYIKAGLVEYTFFPGRKKQLAAYDDCMERHRYDVRWLAFIDIDEFIVPLKDKNIPEFLKRFESFPAVEINWLVFGSNGLREKSDEPVMKRFRRHSQGNHILNRHVKSIVNPRRVFNMIGCHESARINGQSADSNGNPVKVSFRDRDPVQDVIRVNHYAIKSREEFVEKQNRGRASGRQRPVPDAYFDEYDLNDIEDTCTKY